MKLTEYFELALGSLMARRTRSVLTILMVVIGASLMTALNGMSAGFGGFINEQASTLGANVLIVSKAPIIESGFGPGSRQASQIMLNDLTVRTISSLEGVKAVIPYYRSAASVTSEGNVQQASILGFPAEKLHLIVPSVKIDEGDFPSGGDQAGVLVGSNVAHPSSLKTGFAVLNHPLKVEYSVVQNTPGGQKVTTKDRVFIVKGILKPTGNMLVDEVIYISPVVANTIFDKESNYDGIYVISSDENRNDAVQQEITDAYHNDISVTSQKAILNVIQQILSGFTTFILAIAGVSMLVGAVGIITTLYTSVMERTREIGILKALGFGNRSVMGLFLSESIAIGILGGTIGIAVGVVLANLLIRAAQFVASDAPLVAPVIRLEDFLLVWSLSVILSCVAGLYPAWRAANLTPVEALRRE
ncbi:MAG: FtsX-like permease family protein [Thaumarchaeota archaeon]|nr:FtsX-like permease family protein [Nitrososphaerota archaeon]MCL5317394.1 FtsX-like permease family protein [Nitrososphaerota archaeon]